MISISSLKRGLSITLFILMVGCSGGIKTSSSTTKGAELNKYKTYAWIKPGNPEDESRKDDKLFSALILETANIELQKKGFKLDPENPEAVFVFDTKVEERITTTQNPYTYTGFGYGGAGYYGGYYPQVSGGQFVAHETVEGMLFIEMYDTKTQHLLWRGSAKEEITQKNDVEADVKKAVKQIFIRLPVKHKK
jgi:hypothetical protein